MSKKMFDKNIPKKCGYCFFADTAISSGKVLCLKKGPVDFEDCCRKYKYNPLLREPLKMQPQKDFKEEDFIL